MEALLVATCDTGLAGICASAAAISQLSVTTTASVEQAVAACRLSSFSVGLVDASLPGGFCDVIGAISASGQGASAIVLSRWPSRSELSAALRAGAVGYLDSSVRPDALATALRGVLAGEAAITGQWTRVLLEEFRHCEEQSRTGGRERLSERELLVLQLLAEGCSTAEIGMRLYIAKVTVRSHIASILHKLEVADRAAAVALFKLAAERPTGIADPAAISPADRRLGGGSLADRAS